MGSLLAYSGLSAKIKVMQGRLLNEKDYIELAGMSSVAEIVSFLREHGTYGEDLDGLDISKVRRETLEKALNFSKYRDFTSIYRFSDAKQRRYLDLYFIRYETALFKWVLRNLKRDYDREYAAKMANFFADYSSVNIEELLKAQSVDEVTEILAGVPSAMPYYRIFKKIGESGENQHSHYEMALDLYFFRYARDKKERLFNKSDLKNITDMIGTEADMLNIIWIYRAREYYNMTAEETASMIIPIYHRMTQETVRRMISAADRSEFDEILNGTVYGGRLKLTGDKSTSLEKEYYLILGKLYDKFYRKDPYSPAMINNYLYKKETEIRNIITISECVRYGYSSDRTETKIL